MQGGQAGADAGISVATIDAGSRGGPASATLVTSGAGAYWNTQATLTQLGSGTADLSVDEGTTYQRWSGFGGSFNEMGWDALSVLSADQITRAITLLFDPKDGANFTYGRLPIGASDYSMSRYTLDDTAGDFSMTHFSIDRDQQMLIPYIKAALGVRPDIHLWASPWNPPAWMEDASHNMLSDAQTQGAYALYLARFVEEYAKAGLTIEAIHPQNEPGYAAVHWTQSEFIDFFGTYLGPTFAQRNLTAEIWCGTMSAASDGVIATTLTANTAAMKYVKGFGLQWNLSGT
ncbi:MAG: glucosylceramidase, partial [Myxococcales bacterium]|nr:glucosylceramidase [Myxococcales bacterium]